MGRLCILVLLACFTQAASHWVASAQKDDDWLATDVPGPWDGVPALANHDGYVWFRAWVKVPADWKGSDLALAVDQVGSVHEVFLDGVRIGGAGDFPPGFRESATTTNSYTIAEKHIRAGESHMLAVRVYGIGKRKGFHGPAPALVNEARAIALQGTWQYRKGDDVRWAMPENPHPKDATVFSKVIDTTSLPGWNKAHGRGFAPAEAAKSFSVPADLRLDQVVTEPDVKNPVSFHFDERGRLWVMNYLQYPHPAGLKRVSRDMYWRAVYDKVPPPPPNHFKGKDKITIHEDTDGDGVFDKHTTFVEGLNIATALVRGRGGVWVLNPPYLLHYPTKAGSDTPSGDPVVHLEGFGLEDTHSVASSLRWGPDGWLYGAHGSTVTAQIKRPGDKAPIATMIGQHIWRYHPEKTLCEIFAEGGGNAFGVEIDNLGRIFSGHNGGNTRGFHYVQGGYYRKGFEKHGQLSNPYAFGFFEAMKANDSPRFSHAFVLYEGATLPEKYRGQLFAVLPLQGQVMRSEVKADRSSLQTLDLGPVITSKDPWFRPVDIQHGPDGALYVADWHDGYISHLRHHEGQVDYETGRIYRLTAKDAKPFVPFDMSKKTTAELIELLRHENRWHWQTALRLLGDRKDADGIPMLEKLVKNSKGPLALRALWGLNLSGGFNERIATSLIEHADLSVRAWAVRLVGDDKSIKPGLARAFAELAKRETGVMVRVQLAASARRLPAAAALPIVRHLLLHDEDADDIHQPLMLWWALESKCAADRGDVIDLFRDSSLWNAKLAQQTILSRLARRLAVGGTQKELLACAELFRLAPEKKHGKLLMKGVEEAFKGRAVARLPRELLEEIAKLGGGSLAFGVRLGEAAAIKKAISVIQDAGANTAEREELIALLGEAKQKGCVDVLLQVVQGKNPPTLKKSALTSLQAYPEEAIARAIIQLLPQMPRDVHDVAESLLASRKSWSQELLRAVDAGELKPAEIGHESLKRILLHKDESLATLVKKHWGEIKGATTAEMHREIDRVLRVVQAGNGNPYPGKKLFKESCMSCHTLHGQGESVGPDLTPFKRDDLPNMILHIVNPSAEIREGYETAVIYTESGRSLSGVVLEKDGKIVVLRTAEGQKVVLPREEISEMNVSGLSLMPERLLSGLDDQQLRDLFAYLRSTQPLNDGSR